jgi:hypothetical protein
VGRGPRPHTADHAGDDVPPVWYRLSRAVARVRSEELLRGLTTGVRVFQSRALHLVRVLRPDVELVHGVLLIGTGAELLIGFRLLVVVMWIGPSGLSFEGDLGRLYSIRQTPESSHGRRLSQLPILSMAAACMRWAVHGLSAMSYSARSSRNRAGNFRWAKESARRARPDGPATLSLRWP